MRDATAPEIMGRTSLPWAIALVGLAGTAAYAQCNSNASSCVTCHETQGLRSVIKGTQPWHAGHGFGDLCASCHGGERSVQDKERAHVGLRQPMSDTGLSCGGCHPNDTAARVDRYVALALARAEAERAKPAAPVVHDPTADRVLSVLCAGLALVLGAVLIKRRQVGPSPQPAPRSGGRGSLWRAKTWSPVLAGALLGVVVAASAVFWGRPIGVSGAFDKLSAYVGAALFPGSQYYAYLMKPGLTPQVWVVLGLFLGSFAASALSGELRGRWLPDTQWEGRFGSSRLVRFVIAFLGGALVQLGAGIAGGCTSGLAISGGAVMAPAAFLFMAGMFAGGIPTAWLWYRGRRP